MMLLNESGMYSLVLRSRKPQANEFKNWLTHNVIPSIREHGGYIYQQELLNEKEQAKLQKLYPNAEIEIGHFGPVIGTHLGEKAIGLAISAQ